MTVGGCCDTDGIALSRTRARLTPRTEHQNFLTAFFLHLLIACALFFATPVSAQDAKPGVVGLGDLVVTGASGTLAPPANPPLPPGVNVLDETFIDPDGASLKIFDVRNPGGPPQAQLLNSPVKFQAFARDIGQVFGLALDKSNPPNIFAASTSMHGLHIVVPDADGDGRPERIKLGQPGAQWMSGQFGVARGGGPGTVWKINGETGEITKFADILSGGVPNSGAGLGNIAYDAKHKQLFVTDFDTGFIHRLNMTGQDLGTFDHGLQGRPANGMNAVPDNPAERMNITSPTFDAEDPTSWGMTSPERRTWGVAVRGNRLYYAVEAGPQIWSIGINKDGSFGGDPRWELDIPSDPNAYPVSDIAFTGKGEMLLAQRGGISSRYDYSQYHTPRKTRVLRYHLESPDDAATPSRWVPVPEDYSIGFPGIHRNTSGGIAIGYGYKKNSDGSYGFGSCEGTLWSTGDALRDNPVHGAKLAAGGPLNVHGLQGNALGLVKPQNVPPWASYYVDFDSQFDDPQASGHVGDVEIARECKRKHADLRIWKKTRPERCNAGNQCIFEVEIENIGSLTYSGPLVVRDIAEGGAKLISHQPPPPGWDCKELFPGTYDCIHPPVTLAPGEKTVLELTFQLPPWWDRYIYKNCVELLTPGFDKDPRRYNNRSCDYVPTVTPGHEHYKPDLQLEKFAVFGNCDLAGICLYVVRITNVGAAPYTGVLSIHDTIAQPGSSLIDWAPQPQWTCAAGGVAGSYDCTHLAPVTLSPGEFRELTLFVQGPPLAAGHTHVRNCSNIVWQGPHDINVFNEYDCAEVSLFPFGHPDARPKLVVEKKGSPTCWEGAAPGGGWDCFYMISVRNSGGAPYMGPLVVTDTSTIIAGPADSTLTNHDPVPPWNCAPGNGATGVQTCTHPAEAGGIQPGDSRKLSLRMEWPAAIAKPNAVVNCAKISHDNDGDGVAEEIEDCVTTLMCNPGAPGGGCPDDLAVSKYASDDPCWPGFPCNFTVLVNNLGQNNFPAGLVITDVPNPDVGAYTQIFPLPAAITCVPAGTNQTCTVNAPIPAGGLAVLVFDFDVPPAYPWTTLKNCASIPSLVAGNVWDANDEDCAVAFVPGPDLAPHSDTTCQLGAPCKLPASIDNKGQRDFKGSAGVKGTLSPELQITGITSQTPGFTCATTGNASYECKGDRLTIKAGGAVKYELTVSVPANYPHSQVNHIKNLVWPDSKVRDRNPGNDQHISIITIEQPKKPTTPPPPPPPPAGKPDLTVSKTAQQSICLARANCVFVVTISNVGKASYSGGVTLRDTITPGSTRYVGTNPRGWNCTGNTGSVTCTKSNLNLTPGASESITLPFAVPRYHSGTANNCATVSTGIAAVPRSGNTVRDVQAALAAQGYYKGRIDGKTGPRTSAAVREYQRLSNMPQTGRIDAVLLERLLGASNTSSGGQDANPTNNRACASVSIQGEAPPPPPPVCTGGRYRNNHGACVCPTHKPVWTGSSCIQRPPQQCTGGRSRNYKGLCVCPPSLPKWNGQYCSGIPSPQKCTGGRTRNHKGLCVCPPSLPKWNGQYCSGIPGPQQCTGGRTRNHKGQCVCPSSAPTWTGVICIPKINLCSGGRHFSLQKKKCVCPSNKPVWSGSQCNPAHQVCSGGRYYNQRSKKCACPSKKPYWNGSSCTQYSTYPIPPTHGGGGEIKPLPSPVPGCSGGRIRKNGKCACPSSKPLWLGGKCHKFKIPGLKIQ